MRFNNKTLNKIASNFVPNADEILKNARGLHNKNYAKNFKLFDEAGSTLDAGVGSAKSLREAQDVFDKSAKNMNYSNSYINHFDDVSKHAINDPKAHYKTQRDVINKMNGKESSTIGDIGNTVLNYFIGDGVSKGARATRAGAVGVGATGIGIGASYAKRKKNERRY